MIVALGWSLTFFIGANILKFLFTEGPKIADEWEQRQKRDEAVKKMLSLTISACKSKNKYVGICGQGPSDHYDFARWLLDEGIDSVSLNPDTVIETWLKLSKN